MSRGPVSSKGEEEDPLEASRERGGDDGGVRQERHEKARAQSESMKEY